MPPSLCICLLLFHLLAGGALGKTKPTGGDGARGKEKEDGRRAQGMEEFMEDIRRAMSSQWELLQNIRYHTLVTKVRVAQLETQVKKLAFQVEGTSEAPQLVQTGSEEPTPSVPQPVPTPAAVAEEESPCPEEADAGVMLLVEAMRNLTSAYNRLINSTLVDPGQATTIAQDFSLLTNIVHKMRNLTGTPSAPDELVTTTTVATTTAPGEEDGSVPKILVEFSPNVTIDAGGTATLTCRFLNLGNKAVNWVRGTEILTVGQLTYTSDERFQSVHDAGSDEYELQIKSVMSRDEGPYDCQALTEPNIYHRIWLTVQDEQDEGGPSILTNYSTNVTAAGGDTAILNCRVSNLGDATVFWYRDRDLSVMSVGTSTYTTDTRIEAVNEEGSGDWQLMIREVQPSDEGWYDCVLVSPTHVSHKVWLSVLVPTPTPTPDADLGAVSESTIFTVREGETATLACRVSELGDATVSWARSNGLELLTAEQYGLSPDPRFTAVHQGDDWLLHIREAQKEDAGPYECHVSTLPPTLYTFWLQVEGSETSELKVATMDVRKVEGRDAILICQVSGHPKPSITWVKDGFPLTSDRHQVTEDGDLVISSVTKNDEGRYVCIATSPQGSAEGAALLTVKEATRIIKGPRDKVRNMGETVVFRCKAAGDSELQLKVEWLVNGELVNVENELRLERRSNNALVVKWLLEQDSGVYTCLASTKLDAVSASATLTVRGPRVGSWRPSPASPV
ncbi:neurofascin-like isoform X2 [Panulirus ornatus]|uniref:neurofascin-like isoform X2 n=1 Tax=Panulirus ornatus TaxID=150431 RepID=UPI003A8A3934